MCKTPRLFTNLLPVVWMAVGCESGTIAPPFANDVESTQAAVVACPSPTPVTQTLSYTNYAPFAAVGSAVFFTMSNSGTSPWWGRVDASAAPAVLGPKLPIRPTAFGNRLYYLHQDNGAQLENQVACVTGDGASCAGGIYGYRITQFVAELNNKLLMLLFTGPQPDVMSQEIHVADVTTGAETAVLPLPPLFWSSNVTATNLSSGVVLGGATSMKTYGVWWTDGTVAGTRLLLDLDIDHASLMSKLVRLGDAAYFISSGWTGGYQLWKTDGTVAGTVKVANIPDNSTELVASGSNLFFIADSSTSSLLWRSDGTAAGTVPLTGALQSPTNGTHIQVAFGANKVLFTALDSAHGVEPWVSDGTVAGTSLLRDITAGSASTVLDTYKVAVGSGAFFAVGGTWWQTDGTAAGTKVSAIVKGQPFVAGSNVFFDAPTSSSTDQIFMTTTACAFEGSSLPPIDTSKVYRLVSRSSGKCMDVSGYSLEKGADIIQWTCHGGNNQKFRFVALGGGLYQIVNMNSGMAVDVVSYSTADGADIIQWTPTGNSNQRVTLVPTGNGSFAFKFQHSGKCADLAEWSTADGADIVQWACNGGANQSWIPQVVGAL